MITYKNNFLIDVNKLSFFKDFEIESKEKYIINRINKDFKNEASFYNLDYSSLNIFMKKLNNKIYFELSFETKTNYLDYLKFASYFKNYNDTITELFRKFVTIPRYKNLFSVND